jgi:hypothetical protein
MSSRRAAFSASLEEQFVKIPHAVEEQHVRMLGFQPQILLHHRRVVAEGGVVQALLFT